MECSKKNRSSYQTLKDDFNTLGNLLDEVKTDREILLEACMKIAQLRGAEVVKAPDIALVAIARTYKYEKE